MKITETQYRLLTDFYAHCFNVFHEQADDMFSWWAEKLDEAGIAWRVQNSVSAIANNKSSIGLYLRTHLQNKGVIIIKA
ncbi:hypothetical protein EI165_08415 [Pseudoalteromonas nigrifaciens]|uniref:hypothetical protein n=1 Tax=Pseudoalteromonas nigrifaciens TaxID=28109 RepID=UPI001787B95E|nr:hypothetical protein [Pseudoalteromonas nigrifaciens]MBE0420146.1 hypothetical protein [Pseudoalteromonas nigrifaciens]